MNYVPNLDSQDQWQSIANYSSPRDSFYHVANFNLPFRSDALKLYLNIDNAPKDRIWGGHISQLWNDGNNTYQLRYHRIYTTINYILPIEPVENSIIKFEPADHLYNWQLNISGRPYIATTGSIDTQEIIDTIYYGHQQRPTRANLLDAILASESDIITELDKFENLSSRIDLLLKKLIDRLSQSGSSEEQYYTGYTTGLL